MLKPLQVSSPGLQKRRGQGRRSHRIIMGDIKEDWGLEPQRVQGRSSIRVSGGQSPPEAEAFFCETTHNICVKMQQTTVAVTQVDILNDITS